MNGIAVLPFDLQWETDMKTKHEKKKIKKISVDSLPFKNITDYHKMSCKINMDNTIESLMNAHW